MLLSDDPIEGLKAGSFGRETFEFDTGNLGKDLLYEVLVDPINWVTLGGGAVAKLSAKSGVELSTEALEQLSRRTIKKSLSSFGSAYTGNLDEAIATVMKKRFVKNLPKKSRNLLKETLMHNTNLKIIKNVNSVVGAANLVDKTLMRTSMAYVPTLAKTLGASGIRYIDNNILRHAKKYMPEQGVVNTVTL